MQLTITLMIRFLTAWMPIVALGEHRGLYLEPYRDWLETLGYVLVWTYTNRSSFVSPSPWRLLRVSFCVL